MVLFVSKPDEISPLNGKELIQKKIQHWIAMGAINANNFEREYTQDWNLYRNGTATSTKELLKKFQKPVFFIETGSDILTGKSLLKTPENIIVKRANSEWLGKNMNKILADQRPSWDIITVYFAVEDLGEFLEESGWLDLDATKGASWKREINKKQHQFILTKNDQKQELENYLNNTNFCKS